MITAPDGATVAREEEITIKGSRADDQRCRPTVGGAILTIGDDGEVEVLSPAVEILGLLRAAG